LFRKEASSQLSFLPQPDRGPSGLRYKEEFTSTDDERSVLARLRELPLEPFQFGAFEGKRRVASFGFRYDYKLNRVEQAKPIPAWLTPFVERVEDFGGSGIRIAQVLCTEYAPGVGIGWHRDKPQFGSVFGLSLGSACPLRFRRRLGKKWERATLEVMPRSLYAIEGEVRHTWEHSIAGVPAERFSITFRTMA
jgi:alkylated DNA repair dioxygenase AlkB